MKTICCAVTALAALVVGPAVRAEEVAARVNGVSITAAQVDDISARLGSSPDHSAQSPQDVHQDALQALISIQLLAQQAKLEKIEASAGEISRQIEDLKARFPSADAFRQALDANHKTEAELRTELAADLAVQKLIERHVAVKLPADAAAKFYKEHPDQFQHGAEVRASHILFRTAEGSDPAVARQHAEAAQRRVQKGEDFAAVARALSEDTESAPKGGDLGFFPREAVAKEFADAAFALKVGQTSDIVKTQFGYHLIKVTDTRPAGVTPLADVKPQLDHYLETRERDKQERAYVDGLRRKAKIEIVGATH